MAVTLENADLSLIDSNYFMHSTYYVSEQRCKRLEQFVKDQVVRFNYVQQVHHNSVFIFDGDSNAIVANAAVENYKAGRDGKDDKRKYKVFDITRQLVKHLGGAYIREMSMEADFVIGSIALEQADLGKRVVVVTKDKDANQLISKNIGVFDPNDKVMRDKAYVMKKYKIPPNKFAFYLALIGDKIDNIPGLVGCGPVNALKLIEKFGTFKNAVAEIENSSMELPRFEELFRQQLKSMKRCYKMVKLKRLSDCPELPAMKPRNDKKLKHVCDKYKLDYDYIFGKSRL